MITIQYKFWWVEKELDLDIKINWQRYIKIKNTYNYYPFNILIYPSTIKIKENL